MMHSIARCLVSVVSCFRIIGEVVSGVVGCLHDAEESEDRVAIRAVGVSRKPRASLQGWGETEVEGRFSQVSISMYL